MSRTKHLISLISSTLKTEFDSKLYDKFDDLIISLE